MSRMDHLRRIYSKEELVVQDRIDLVGHSLRRLRIDLGEMLVVLHEDQYKAFLEQFIISEVHRLDDQLNRISDARGLSWWSNRMEYLQEDLTFERGLRIPEDVAQKMGPWRLPQSAAVIFDHNGLGEGFGGDGEALVQLGGGEFAYTCPASGLLWTRIVPIAEHSIEGGDTVLEYHDTFDWIRTRMSDGVTTRKYDLEDHSTEKDWLERSWEAILDPAQDLDEIYKKYS